MNNRGETPGGEFGASTALRAGYLKRDSYISGSFCILSSVFCILLLPMDFYQDPPQLTNLFRIDGALQDELRRRLPAPILDRFIPIFDDLGDRAANELSQLAEEAEANPPVLVPYDPWGKRIDEVDAPGRAGNENRGTGPRRRQHFGDAQHHALLERAQLSLRHGAGDLACKGLRAAAARVRQTSD
jgi:hypothetical protein